MIRSCIFCRVQPFKATGHFTSRSHQNALTRLKLEDLATCRDSSSTSRRGLLQFQASIFSLIALIAALPNEVQAIAQAGSSERRGLSRYIKKKKLDPLENYVPTVIAARNQLQRAGRMMRNDLQGARELLRLGAFDGLRDNIKALGEYAAQNGTKDATKLADNFFLAVQNFDFTLFQAKRNNQPVREDSDAALDRTLKALGMLLATVPEPILDVSEKIVKAVEESSSPSSTAEQTKDPQLNQLLQLVPGE